MKAYIEERVLELADYLIKNNSTVRETAIKYNISKSTVHKDLVERLPEINPQLKKEVKAILDVNKSERHIRGGNATRIKYAKV